jgi:hypothetical protein
MLLSNCRFTTPTGQNLAKYQNVAAHSVSHVTERPIMACPGQAVQPFRLYNLVPVAEPLLLLQEHSMVAGPIPPAAAVFKSGGTSLHVLLQRCGQHCPAKAQLQQLAPHGWAHNWETWGLHTQKPSHIPAPKSNKPCGMPRCCLKVMHVHKHRGNKAWQLAVEHNAQ